MANDNGLCDNVKGVACGDGPTYSEFQLNVKLSGSQLYCFGSFLWCLMVIFRENALKAHCTLPAQYQRAGRDSLRLTGKHSGAFSRIKSHIFHLLGRDQQQC